MTENIVEPKREKLLSELIEEFAALPVAEQRRLIDEAEQILRARGGRS
jgi:hypothetical protein